MATYAEERAERQLAAARRAQQFRFEPVLGDMGSAVAPEVGQIVVKQRQSVGQVSAPFAYVADARTGKFIGMVYRASLKPVARKDRV